MPGAQKWTDGLDDDSKSISLPNNCPTVSVSCCERYSYITFKDLPYLRKVFCPDLYERGSRVVPFII